MTQDSLHIDLVLKLLGLLKAHFSADPRVGIFGDLKVFFDLPGLPDPGPDLFVARGVEDRDRRRTSFRTHEERGRIVLVVEVVSPEYREKDYESLPPVYEKAGIDEYLIIEALGTYLTDAYKLTGHRLGEDRRYHPIEHDEQGGLELESVGLWIAPDPDGWGLQLVDQATGQRLLSFEEASKAAKKQVAEEAQARQAAERQAAEEARARKTLEEKIVRLEKELQRQSRKA